VAYGFLPFILKMTDLKYIVLSNEERGLKLLVRGEVLERELKDQILEEIEDVETIFKRSSKIKNAWKKVKSIERSIEKIEGKRVCVKEVRMETFDGEKDHFTVYFSTRRCPQVMRRYDEKSFYQV